jgi:hypothetical protein
MTQDGIEDDDDLTDPCTLQLTRRELQLVLKYGYPFPREAELLRSSKVKDGWHVIHVDAYWIGMWIGDIVRSARTIRSQRLLEELDELCDVLETAENNILRVRGA